MFFKQEFEQWLAANSQHFTGYSQYQIAELALACGFRMSDIGANLNNWLDKSKRKLRLWESSFFEHWVSIQMYEHGHAWEESNG